MDKFHVYRPMLDLIGRSEGTDKGDGYNETLAYGAYTGGDVDLVSMTLGQIDALQSKMLKHPKNSFNSSAIGRYQIVRTTLRSIRKTLGLTGQERFDEPMQDRMACYLLGVRGIDKWLAGRLSTDTMLTNLAQEWASLPTPKGKGYYSGQRASVTVPDVKHALSKVRERHMGEQPKEIIEVERKTIPEEVEQEVDKKSGFWQWLTGIVGSGGLGLGWLAGMDWQGILAGGAVLVVMIVIILLLRRQIVSAVKDIRAGLA